MSKEIKTQEPTKSNKKYIVLAIVVILAIIGIMMNNGSEEDATKATTTVTTTEQAPIAEQLPVAEEKTIETESAIARIDITTPLVNADEPQFEVYVDGSEEPLKQTEWLSNNNLQGYVIQEKKSPLNLRIKANDDITIQITLRGIRDVKNEKPIEHWVTYKLFVIDNKEIILKNTPLCYSKRLSQVISANSGEEYKVHIEWQGNNEK